jgi:hypothetical protein
VPSKEDLLTSFRERAHRIPVKSGYLVAVCSTCTRAATASHSSCHSSRAVSSLSSLNTVSNKGSVGVTTHYKNERTALRDKSKLHT